MRKTIIVALSILFFTTSVAEGQRKRERRKNRNRSAQSENAPSRKKSQAVTNDMVDNPLAIGQAGVAWFTTWDTGLAEAKRSNRPIFFMTAATTCSGVPGVF